MRSTTSPKLYQASVYLDEDLAEFLYQTSHELRQTESEYIRELIRLARNKQREELIKRAKRS